MRRFFDPAAYRVVLFDQRNCGRSLPHAAEPGTSLAVNTTHHLVRDIERLRDALGIESWLVFGGSWGSTLALAYATAHRDRVSEVVLFGVTTGRHLEFDWVFRGGLSVLFPAEWERLRAGSPDEDVVAGYDRLLNDPDPSVRARAAEEWCRWESASLDWPPTGELAGRFTDPTYALAFARIVVHYAKHYGWLEDGALLRRAAELGAIPGVLVNGRLDFHAPIGWAWELARTWPGAELVVVPDAGHSFDGIARELVRSTDGFRP
jgi:proline iminopeptidase